MLTQRSHPAGPGRKAQVLRRSFGADRLLRVAGVHDGLSALLAEGHEFDALWVSGLGVSAAHGVPDASILGMSDFLAAARLADRSSGLPVIADCDTGFGDVNNVVHLVREYERAGIAAVCLEDKTYPKRNSFSTGQELADPAEFAANILAGKRAQRTAEFIIVARLESLVAGAGQDDAMTRAMMYVDAGADAILIHSRSPSPDEVLSFARRFRSTNATTPLIAVPTTYPSVTVEQLAGAGVSMVIYANQILRAFVRAGRAVLPAIMDAGSSAGVESSLADLGQILAMLGTDEISATDTWFTEATTKFRRTDVPRSS